MNWYKFKVELSAWAAKTALCVFTTVLVLRVGYQPSDSVRAYPVSLRVLAENEWIMQSGFLLAVVILWLCYWRIFRVYRGRRAYKRQ